MELACEMLLSLVQDFSSSAFLGATDTQLLVPHLVICHLDRPKIDANRPLKDAIVRPVTAHGVKRISNRPIGGAEIAWYEYHSFLEIAKMLAAQHDWGAHYFDIHGNTASIKVMMGNMIHSQVIDECLGLKSRKPTSDEWMQELATHLSKSSIRSLAEQAELEKKIDMLLGNTSLGYYLERQGIPATPVGTDPVDWGGNCFYSGGYNTGRHSSMWHGGLVNATQINTH